MINRTLRILIVDDEKPNLMVLSSLLKSEAQISLATNGQSALEKARSLKPDLILLDIVLPDQNGFDVIKELKASKATHAIPVMFITGLGDVSSEEKGFDLGACDYIHKPFHLGIVKARVKLHLTLARQRIMLEELANVDPLTAIANRRKCDQHVLAQWTAAYRKQSSILIAMVDVDEFKLYNDEYGHDRGDNALSLVAKALSEQLHRSGDFVARYGGEEFMIVIADTNITGARTVIDNCCNAVRALELEHKSSHHSVVTISVGALVIEPEQQLPKAAIKQADELLYKAKESGRDKVCWND